MTRQLRRLLASCDAFDEPFQPDVESRLLLFPTDGFLLTRGQFEALGLAAARFGDRTGYCVITEGFDLARDQADPESFRFSLGSYQEYVTLRDRGDLLQENAILPESGSWAVLVSQEFHAILGCPHSFAAEFRQYYPQVLSEFDKFVDAWEANAQRIGSDISWLQRLSAHLRPETSP